MWNSSVAMLLCHCYIYLHFTFDKNNNYFQLTQFSIIATFKTTSFNKIIQEMQIIYNFTTIKKTILKSFINKLLKIFNIKQVGNPVFK